MGKYSSQISALETQLTKPSKYASRIMEVDSGALAKQPEFQAPSSPQGLQQTPTAAGTGKLDNRALNALEAGIETATPYGSLAGLVKEPMGGSGQQMGKTALRVADIGFSAIPGVGLLKAGAKQTMSPMAKSLLLSGAGAGVGAATGEAMGIENPLAKAALTFAGGIKGPQLASRFIPGIKEAGVLAAKAQKPTSSVFGDLSPAQAQIGKGELTSPEIELEALNRSSKPLQQLAQRQGQAMESGVTGALGKVAPVTSPTLAAANFQQSFEKAKDTAKGLMNELNEVVKAESKGVNHNVIGVELKNSWINRLKREGWKVSKEGKILEDVTAPGYSPQAAQAIQTFLDQAPKVKNLETLTNFKRNFGSAIEKAFREGGNYAQGIQKRLYGATAAAGKAITPEFAKGTVGEGNKAWSTMMRVEELGNMEKMLAKDPSKFYDTLLQGAASDKNFLAKMEKTLPKAGLKMQDIQSVAVSQIADKMQTALRNPARDEVDKVLAGLTALEKEYGKIPINARKSLLGESAGKIEEVVKAGQQYKEWANKLRNAPETARNMPLSIINKVANGIELLAGNVPFVGRQVGAGLGEGVRKLGQLADERKMARYLEEGAQVKPPKEPLKTKFGRYGAVALKAANQ